jgi:ubiquinone/menaquinone biosynthesis C-methylase UbiE
VSGYDAWAPHYDEWASEMTEDVAHYVALAREADGPIVELMVGTGRVAIEVVKGTGKPVVGIDSSPAMLEIARERGCRPRPPPRPDCRSSCAWATSASLRSTSRRR